MSTTEDTNQNQPAEEQDRAPSTGSRLLRAIRDIPRAWNNFLADLTHRPRTRFLTILWAVVIIFLSVNILTGGNPFRLLVPGMAFQPPTLDGRPVVELRGVGRTDNRLISYKRRMASQDSVEAAVGKLAFLVSEPVGLREGMSEREGYADLEPLPRLGFSVRQIWFRDKGLIVDLRKSTLLKETSLFHKNRHRASVVPAEAQEDEKDKDRTRRRRQKEAETRAHAHYLDSYFRSLTASIFAAHEEVESVTYLLDGESDTIDEMEFDLDVRYTR